MQHSPHLVMIHGLLGSLNFFAPATRLANVTVHTPDLIGYGRPHNITGRADVCLEDQARWIAEYIQENCEEPVWLLGHSVGGAVAMMVTHHQPHRITGVINIEGNFTLQDAFWCQKIAGRSPEMWADEYQKLQSAPIPWLQASGIAPTPQRVAWAQQILTYQPAQTVQTMAQAVLQETGSPAYLQSIHEIVDRGVALYLLAGERSAQTWDVPEWVKATACRYVIQPSAGHLMMLEDPVTFCRLVSEILLPAV